MRYSSLRVPSNHMKKYWIMYTNAIQDAFEDRGRILLYILEDFIPCLIQIVLWIGIFKFSGQISAGWSLNHLISYYLVLTFFSLTLNHYSDISISHDIYNGSIANYVIKPVPYLNHSFIGSAGWKTVRFFISIIPYILLILIFRQYLSLTPNLSGTITTFIFAVIAYFSIFFYKAILGLTAFWLVENYGVINLIWVLQVIFSGLLVPFDFLPPILKQISFLLPFRFFYYLPAAIFLNQDPISSHFMDLLVSLSWLLVLFVLSRIIYKKGLIKLTDTRQ